MKVSSALARPVHGVSQQANKVRKDGQVTLQDNMIPSAVKGLMTRMGGYEVAIMDDDTLASHTETSFWHHYKRDDDEEYFIFMDGVNLPRVFDIDGVEATVTDEASTSYHVTPDALDDIRMITIADRTIVVNRSVAPRMTTATSAAAEAEALIYVAAGAYGREYEVLIDGVRQGFYETPDGADAAESPEAAADYIANKLFTEGTQTTTLAQNTADGTSVVPVGSAYSFNVINLSTYPGAEFKIAAVTATGVAVTPHSVIVGQVLGVNYIYIRYLKADVPVGTAMQVYFTEPDTTSSGLGNMTGFTSYLKGNVIHISNDTNTSFEVEVRDGSNGTNLVAIQGSVSNLSDLPPKVPDSAEGYVVKVQGVGNTEDTGYYLKATNADGVPKWVETVGPGISQFYDRIYMPHFLNDDGDGTFTWVRGTYTSRDVGDDDSNPLPGFINSVSPSSASDYPIENVGLFQGRLFFLFGEYIILSKTNDYFNFFRQTAQTSVQDDPLEGYADSSIFSGLKEYAIMDNDLILFSSEGQFKIDGAKPVTKENLVLALANTFETQLKGAPRASGESVLFTFNYGKYTGVRELFTDSTTDTRRALPVTEHVDSYILGEPRVTSVSQNNQWYAVSASETNVIYVYNWLWSGAEKVQSAWYRWVFPTTDFVESFFFSDDVLWVVIWRGDRIYLEKYDLGTPVDTGLDFHITLDRKKLSSATYNAAGYWTWTDPYPNETLDDIKDNFLFVKGTGAYTDEVGGTLNNNLITRVGTELRTTEELNANVTAALWGGRKYSQQFIPNAPVIKDQRDRVVGLDLFIVDRMYLNYEELGEVTVLVEGKNTTPYTYTFEGRLMGDPNNVVGTIGSDDGSFDFPVKTRAEDLVVTITSESHRALVVRDLEWKGKFNQRGRRV